jgi:hypothetical protein
MKADMPRASEMGLIAFTLFCTLALGVAIGVLGAGALAQLRAGQMVEGRGPGGFGSHVSQVIGISPEDQDEGLRQLISAAEIRNREITSTANDDLRESLEDLRLALQPFLNEAQQARLDGFARRPGPGVGPRGGGPGRPPPGVDAPRGGPPPDSPPPHGGPGRGGDGRSGTEGPSRR